MQPFLKWPGGKRWLVAKHSTLFPTQYTRYIEPFLGSGSVFFHLEPKRSIISDANSDLVATYIALRDNWREVHRLLKKHHRNHSASYYYEMRACSPRAVTSRAARLIYLNRTCFNGIYRVNLNGHFNVPKGTRDSVLHEDDDFFGIAQVLQAAEIHNSDFEPIIDSAKFGDFIFADPPYTVRHNKNGFVKYNEDLFSWEDQVRLAKSLAKARSRGAKVLLTNANHQSIKELYRSTGFVFKSISRYSSISAEAGSRKRFQELLVVSN